MSAQDRLSGKKALWREAWLWSVILGVGVLLYIWSH